MQNIRHFWSSIRPNGPQRPLILDRLELRICDFVHDINLLLGITAMLELRILQLFDNINSLDPLTASIFSIDELSEICDQNEINAAKNSLNSELINWQDGKKVNCKEWIQNLLSDLTSTAEKFNMKHLLKPIYIVLEEGNQSIKWINQYKKGLSIEKIMKNSIDDMIMNEDESV
jgi:predicted glutamate--cysteine ligase